VAAGRLVLDLSRTLGRATLAAPTGIDRVEMAYAEALIARVPDRLDFAAMHPLGRFGALPHDGARRLVELTARRWRGEAVDADALRALARRLHAGVLLRPVPAGRARPGTYLLVSHHHLDRPELVAAARRRHGRFACFVHDLIPMELPEYARPNEAERHERRMRTMAALSDAVIVNSADTARGVHALLRDAGRAPPVLVAPLGVDLPPPVPGAAAPAAAPDGRPVFVIIGTIEPRKNHIMLLNVWRRLAETMGASTPRLVPRLVIVGRRGWENENVIDMIERCRPLRGVVEEHNVLSDRALRDLLGQACALLLPTFSEGYGLPLAEALAQNVPVLCSDIPALREVGGAVPEYLDPLDGLGWLAAVRDYAAPGSPRRAAQMARLRDWQPPRWDTHMDAVMELLDG
jgi:glycosyltransferase involved in cell wall biosynthesis